MYCYKGRDLLSAIPEIIMKFCGFNSRIIEPNIIAIFFAIGEHDVKNLGELNLRFAKKRGHFASKKSGISG